MSGDDNRDKGGLREISQLLAPYKPPTAMQQRLLEPVPEEGFS